MRSTLLCLMCVAAACDGEIAGPAQLGTLEPVPLPGSPAATSDEAPQGDTEVAYSGLRRLTQDEYDNTLADLLGDTTRPGSSTLPDDPYTPFDNDYRSQTSSQALVDGADLLAADAIARLLADPARRDRVVGCRPRRVADAQCFGRFVRTFGRRALRRPLEPQTYERLLAMLDYAVRANDFYVAVDTVMRVLLQHPRFLFRVEQGTPDVARPGVMKLDDYEVAARLSYLLWGTTPSEALLDLAEQHALSSPEGIAAVAQKMLGDSRALSRIDRFHAMWLGYDRYMPESPSLVAKLRNETRATLQRVVFDEHRPWQDVLRLDETFVDDELAAHYGLPAPGSATPKWVPYGASGRRGILSQATFLSVGAKFDDTSPTRRGLFIRQRLYCQELGPPPPNVNPDDPPGVDPNACKIDRYAAHTQGSCAGCHVQIDPIGFGLENYDAEGRYRTTEPGKPQCTITGQGQVVGVGMFHGPGELAQVTLQSGKLNGCFLTQLYRFASGHAELDGPDAKVLAPLQKRFGAADFQLTDVLLAYVSTPSFSQRRAEE